MLFNSLEFILLFLPTTLALYYALVFRNPDTALSTLALCSLFFYAWWNTPYLGLLLGSVLINYLVYRRISRSSIVAKKPWLILGVAVNLSAIGYFKYIGFLTTTLVDLDVWSLEVDTPLLPLAISFFTFQQIAFLVDTYRGDVGEINFRRYVLFVTFFPQLIAGPIVHHREMMPQFMQRSRARLKRIHLNLAVGLSVFSIGLFKKVILADNLASFATPVFSAANLGITPTFLEAWFGSLAYTFQLYFDFSGYSDMAIGLAYMFGVRLPANFNSPYKACSIVEFWRRWHMTLSRFLRDYLYIPLGGSKAGRINRYRNLMITMLLGGLWHGAGWTFVLWGGLHGAYLVVNHVWAGMLERGRLGVIRQMPIYHLAAWTVTFLAVVFAWVIFRAESLAAGLAIWKAMIGLNGIALPDALAPIATFLPLFLQDLVSFSAPFENGFADWKAGLWLIVVSMLIALRLPNIHQIFRAHRKVHIPSKQHVVKWRPNATWAIGSAALMIASLVYITTGGNSEFLYFNF